MPAQGPDLASSPREHSLTHTSSDSLLTNITFPLGIEMAHTDRKGALLNWPDGPLARAAVATNHCRDVMPTDQRAKFYILCSRSTSHNTRNRRASLRAHEQPYPLHTYSSQNDNRKGTLH